MLNCKRPILKAGNPAAMPPERQDMGSLYKQKTTRKLPDSARDIELITKPIPAGAELFEHQGQPWARWRDKNGKNRSAPVTHGPGGTPRIPDRVRWTDSTGKVRTAKATLDASGKPRVAEEASTYTAAYRDHSGVIVRRATGCRDATAARARLNEWEKQTEHVKAGILTPGQHEASKAADVPIGEHVAAYLDHLAAKAVHGRRVSASHLDNVKRQLNRLIKDLKVDRLSHIDRSGVEAWIKRKTTEPTDRKDKKKARVLSARTIAMHIGSLTAFLNWAVRTSRIVASPLAGMGRGNLAVDTVKNRRAMTEDELIRVLDVARRRPLESALTITSGPRKGEPANIEPERREALESIGRERALIYKTLVLTGLRKGELASITIGQAILDGPNPHLVLHARDAKTARKATIALRDDLRLDLREHLAAKMETLRHEPLQFGKPVLMRLPDTMPLLDVPRFLVKILDRDLAAAGIAKVDDSGRSLDVHALRGTFATHLSMGGVAPRTAQAALRHSTINLTMNNYTDPVLLDVRGALDTLPALPLDGGGAARESQRAIAGERPSILAKCVTTGVTTGAARTADSYRKTLAFSGIPERGGKGPLRIRKRDKTPVNIGEKMVNGAGLEPAATGLKVRCSTD